MGKRQTGGEIKTLYKVRIKIIIFRCCLVWFIWFILLRLLEILKIS